MDKNSIIGLLLMGLIIFGFTYINRPSAEELERQRIEREQMEAQEAAKAADNGALKFDSITSAEVATIKSTVLELGVTV
ncbi:MAG: membrane protein insertase YidC, partial [Duncaniella sp.]|nr:membrane protein insertase YidC [Duncaniella sp.]